MNAWLNFSYLQLFKYKEKFYMKIEIAGDGKCDVGMEWNLHTEIVVVLNLNSTPTTYAVFHWMIPPSIQSTSFLLVCSLSCNFEFFLSKDNLTKSKHFLGELIKDGTNR
jgi:hypothetical protein